MGGSVVDFELLPDAPPFSHDFSCDLLVPQHFMPQHDDFHNAEHVAFLGLVEDQGGKDEDGFQSAASAAYAFLNGDCSLASMLAVGRHGGIDEISPPERVVPQAGAVAARGLAPSPAPMAPAPASVVPAAVPAADPVAAAAGVTARATAQEAPHGYTVNGTPRKRAKKRETPPSAKTDEYWARRNKNNERARLRRAQLRGEKLARQMKESLAERKNKELKDEAAMLRRQLRELRKTALAMIKDGKL